MKKMKAILTAAAGYGLVLLTAAGCSGKGDAAAKTITIGTSFPMTGTVAADGKMIVNAIQLAADQTNAAGGINGKQIVIQPEDDAADPSTAAAVANKFASDSKVMAVLTSYNSSCGLAQIPIYKSVGLSAISPVTTSPAITGMSNYYYRTCNSDTFVGAMCANACNTIGMKNVYILYENDDYGAGIYAVYTKKLGMTVAGTDTFVYGQTKDFSTIITKIRNSKADGIMFIGLVTEMGLLANQAGGFKIPVFADEGCYSPAMITEGGALVEGLYSLGAFNINDTAEKVQQFAGKYKTKFSSEPSSWSALGYDAAMTLFEAIKSCRTVDRKSINDALQTISYEGVTGTNKFVNSDVSKQYSLFQIKNGKWVKIEQ
jgi:branched-chain amino acid transport system substrate-binding protein